MKQIRDAVMKCLDKYEDDALLIPALNKIIDEFGNIAYPIILHIFTHILLEPAEAEKNWREIISHYESMARKLERPISIRTAICDYFCSIHKTLKNPKVVEIHVFEKTLEDSRIDGLTGLLNRQALEATLNNEYNRAKRHHKNLSFIFFDLDHFKKVNDKYGHLAGDEALKQVAKIITIEKRLEDTAARYGGEEMVLILPETSKANAYTLAERIRVKVEETTISWHGRTFDLTISGGISSYPLEASDPVSLVDKADEALQRAKQSGKNMVL
ncbi:MAG: GGDEF domain-containing protein [Deltaproteobacteria bacterium]